MVEIELKFQIPEARRTALLKALDPKKSQIIDLKARYFDTPERDLAQHHAALRQRLEGDIWVQTFKAARKNHIERFEHNVILGALQNTPELDLTVYDAEPEALAVLQGIDSNLALQFETDIQRTQRVIEFQDALIEVSLDVGQIRTLNDAIEVYEIEFELKQGQISDLLEFSFAWVKKYQLWLDVRSKAEMGNLLLQQHAVSPATIAKDIQLVKKDSSQKNLCQIIAQQLQHLLPNIAAISAQLAEDEHIVQAQIALDHLQLSTSLFKEWNPAISDKFALQLAAFKQQFDQLQHLQHMQQTLGAFLQNPTTQEQLAKDVLYAKEKLIQLVRSTQNVHHYLELLIFSLSESKIEAKDLKQSVQQSLQQQYRALNEQFNQSQISDFESLDILALRIHELKFSFPILTHVYDVKNLQKYSKALHDAALAAKEYKILASSAQYIQNTELEASDWFVLGWLTAKQEVYAERLLEATEQFLVSRKLIK
jgi:triphosphatase